MTLKDFLANIQALVDENPEILDYTVINSIDDEGNGFNRIYFKPSIGLYEDNEFINQEQFDEWNREGETPNSICIN